MREGDSILKHIHTAEVTCQQQCHCIYKCLISVFSFFLLPVVSERCKLIHPTHYQWKTIGSLAVTQCIIPTWN